MSLLSKGIVDRSELAELIDEEIQGIDPEVVRVRYSFGYDWSGEPAVYFRVVLSDEASQEAMLTRVADRIESKLCDKVRLFEDWGLQPYFSFRSKSEQDGRNDPDWI